MKKLVFGEPIVLAQSTTAAILFDGYQDPHIRSNQKGEIFVSYHVRRDCDETFGQEDNDPILKTTDGGKTWAPCTDISEWVKCGTLLANGDVFSFREEASIPLDPNMPLPDKEQRTVHAIANQYTAVAVEEAEPYLNADSGKVFHCRRILKGTNEVVEETVPVRWEGMPLMAADTYMRKANGGLSVAVDENGTVWTTAYGPHILPNGTLASKYCCCHVLRSDDNGHSWDYVNTIDYKEEYNNPNCIDIEGFNETSIMVAANGDLFFVIRSGSLHPFIKGDKDHPAPKFYCARSKDKGKTWDVKPFYDFGVFPVSVRLKCGTTLLTSGRPGVYIRQCDDENLENWADPVFLLTVPEEDIYGAYYEYSCSNTGIVAVNDNTAMMVYSNFKLTAPDGKRAKSIVVQTVTVEDETN